MEEEIQRKDSEPHDQEAGDPLEPRVQPAAPVTYATPSADERSNGPKMEATQTTKDQQVGCEDRAVLSGDDCERSRVAERPATLGDNEGAKLESIIVPIGDGSNLDEELEEQPAMQEMIKGGGGTTQGYGMHAK